MVPLQNKRPSDISVTMQCNHKQNGSNKPKGMLIPTLIERFLDLSSGVIRDFVRYSLSKSSGLWGKAPNNRTSPVILTRILKQINK